MTSAPLSGPCGELGTFPKIADRLQQGLLNEVLLGRLLNNNGGFASVDAFHVDETLARTTPSATPLGGNGTTIDTSQLYYNGNSQGGIMGGALTAISPDITRAELGVPAMNYSVLLNRSTDFNTYKVVLDPAYPSAMTQAMDPVDHPDALGSRRG